ncbi:hypothetical protein Nepgr_014616 [Nepenthes gracilis]|uniref:Cation-transporting P-type ATPase C-terminal domain-containing protein n=1 Tax=Nepenthes gracilis TaxID=150966 RepID=A0AAD3SL68_NEPGR|nr:hypothetical protein Nepgr_014616 [Nepenthes gracilis]
MDIEIGKVHTQIHEASQNEEDTPLKKKLNEFGKILTVIIGVICALVWPINLKYFLAWDYVDGWPRNFRFSFEKWTYYFEIAVALAVAAIPEGLPAVITTCLALGTRKMAQKNALVRKLSSVETLGCTTVICFVKTGTLATNQMAVANIVAMGHSTGAIRKFNVEGTTYNPFDGRIQDWPAGHINANLQMIAKVAAICNDAGVKQSGHHFVANGIPTEAALKVMVEKMGLPSGFDHYSSSECDDVLSCCQVWNKSERRIATLEFDRDRKSMGVIGAVENLLARSSFVQLLDGSTVVLDESTKGKILDSLEEMSKNALRCLGFAFKDDLPNEFATYNGDHDHLAHELLLNPSNYFSIESKLIFVGFAGIRDPPRQEVHQAIEDCRAAGIRVIVITGDNRKTAEAICHEIAVFGPNEDFSSRSLTGKEFMERADQKKHLRHGGGLLFSRAEPRHKQEIVRLLKDDGEVVAMAGEGVNDAPALKLADIGIAMGIAGTETSCIGARMDDVGPWSECRCNSDIVPWCQSGRHPCNIGLAGFQVQLIRNLYMISSNIGEVASIFLTFVLGIPEGLIPVQLLWVNLVTDGPPATTLGFNPPDRDIMKKPPRQSDDSLVNAWTLFHYLGWQLLEFSSCGIRMAPSLALT